MVLNLDYDFLFVGRDQNSFLENYSLDFKEEYGDKSGHIFANIEIKNNLQDSETLGAQIFETMQSVFFENVDLPAYDRFENTLKAINVVLNEYKESRENDYIGDLNVVIAAIVDDELFLTQTGEAEVYLLRKQYVSVISDGLNDGESGDIFENIASGKLEPNDYVFFSTTRLLRYMSKTDFLSCVRRSKVDVTLSEIQDLVSTEMLGRLSVTAIYCSKKKEEGASEEILKHVKASSEDLEMEEILVEHKEELYNARVKEGLTTESAALKIKDRLKGAAKGSSKKSFSLFNKIKDFIFDSSQSKNKILIFLLVIIALLIVSIFVANNLSVKNAQLESYETILNDVELKISEAESKGTYDKEGALVVLDKAYSDALEVQNSGYYREKANAYLAQIEELRDTLDNVNRVDLSSLYLDLSEDFSSINALGFVEVDDRVFVYTEHEIYELILDELSEPIVIDEAESIIAATGFDDRGSIIFLTQSSSLIEYREGAISYLDTIDEDFRPAVALDDWSNKVYLLDAESGQIWKYTFNAVSEQFGAAESYLAENSEDLLASKDLAIDASVYVLGADSEIYRFYGGEDSNLSIYNRPLNSFDSASVVYTNEVLDQVFVVDSSINRLFVFDKDESTGRLNYNAQYLFDLESQVRDVYVDKGSEAMYVVTENQIFKLNI